ncbi:hypothetical protein LCGC14_2311580, partial [marine sediment metagenome]
GTVLLYYQILYSRDSSLTKLEGTWYEDSYASATFDPDGSFFWQDPFGCVYDGQASIIDPDYSVYVLAMTVSLRQPTSLCSWTGGPYTGLGVLTDGWVTNDLFVMHINRDMLFFASWFLRL